MFGLIEQMLMVSKRPTYVVRSPHITPKRLQHLANNHAKQTLAAVEKYRHAMQGRGWLTTGDIENLLGFNCTVANAFLRKLEGLGYVAKEPRDGGEYIKNRGWKWKWIKPL